MSDERRPVNPVQRVVNARPSALTAGLVLIAFALVLVQ